MSEPLHIRGSMLEWKRVFPGVGRISLRDDADTGAQTLLFKLDPGASYPEHDHPTGEDIYIVEGDMQIGEVSLTKGDYYRTASRRPELECVEERLHGASRDVAESALSRP